LARRSERSAVFLWRNPPLIVKRLFPFSLNRCRLATPLNAFRLNNHVNLSVAKTRGLGAAAFLSVGGHVRFVINHCGLYVKPVLAGANLVESSNI
jgi:hypothetical protein